MRWRAGACGDSALGLHPTRSANSASSTSRFGLKIMLCLSTRTAVRSSNEQYSAANWQKGSPVTSYNPRLLTPPEEEEIYPYRRVWRSLIVETSLLFALTAVLFVLVNFLR